MKNYLNHFGIHKDRYLVELVFIGVGFLLGLLVDLGVLSPDPADKIELIGGSMLLAGAVIAEMVVGIGYVADCDLAIAFGFTRKAFVKEFLLSGIPLYVLLYPALLISNLLERAIYSRAIVGREVVSIGEKVTRSPLIFLVVLAGVFVTSQIMMALWERFRQKIYYILCGFGFVSGFLVSLFERSKLSAPQISQTVVLVAVILIELGASILFFRTMIKKSVKL